MRIRLNKAHFPVTALGPGRRIGLWVQGCHVGCRGCVSRDTWDPDPEKEVEIELLLAWCRVTAGRNFDGVTISGGEPFEQPEALGALLDGLHAWRLELPEAFDVLCYSGLPLKRLERDHGGLLARLDAIIPEPYVRSLPRGKIWRGSANQPLVPLSELGWRRYGPFIGKEFDGKGAMQVGVDQGRIWYIGIPDRGDMERLDGACRRRGVVQEKVSWRA